jgi:CubicO group peptidase (beta-lactamase class C family)
MLSIISQFGCTKDDQLMEDPEDNGGSYFPPSDSDSWDVITPENLKWNVDNLSGLYNYLADNSTRAFLVLKNGKIVIEKYWGNTITSTGEFDQNSNWYWASAGKTLTSFLVGLAQEEGFLDIEDKTSDHIGTGWSSMPIAKEDLVTIRNQLTMTTGLDYTVDNIDCTDPECLLYKSDAGSQWFYHNAAYTLLDEVVSNASNSSYNQFMDEKIELRIGMNGTWIKSEHNNVYWSTARDAARFGILMLNKGKWQNNQIMADLDYFEAMVSTSQSLNPSYGYLWWLNGKTSIIIPGLPNSFSSSLSPSAPADLCAAMGKNGQFIDVIPSENLVVIRFGEAPDNSLVPLTLHDGIWEHLNKVIY